ncbi:uncharacterized protein LOC135097210 [Scylla paramamosain]|uniref:uncharacterized protein LOC135097210 n=1 Tax=Scylla paramamosain TaxID=85552 RepID=UPI003082ED06
MKHSVSLPTGTSRLAPSFLPSPGVYTPALLRLLARRTVSQALHHGRRSESLRPSREAHLPDGERRQGRLDLRVEARRAERPPPRRQASPSLTTLTTSLKARQPTMAG